MSKHKFNNILLTGAAGALGEQLRKTLSKNCNLLKISDKEKLFKKFENEKVNQADLSSAEAMIDLTKNIDCVVHMGGQSIEGSWSNVLNSNIIGMYNLYEGCRKNNVKRVIWASSVHTVGFYPRSEIIDSKVPPRPDSNYGLSKVFGESLKIKTFPRCKFSKSFIVNNQRNIMSTSTHICCKCEHFITLIFSYIFSTPLICSFRIFH